MTTEETKTRLLAEREEVLSRRMDRPAAERCPDALDQALALQQVYRTADDRERDTRLLHQIDLALTALESNEYGLCAICEAPIKPKRLEAIPWATECFACAEQEEAKCKLTN